jgi:hypothetical protein
MTTVTLAPLVKQQFNQNGIPLAGGKLFVYNAGTTTKALTYTDATGDTPNTNPIILDANGQCGVWLLPSLAYKFILSPATDTDPPTNPFWTVDNVTTVQGIAVGNMTDEKGQGGTYGFAANVDFTPGITTQLTLSQNYGSSDNLWVTFDGTEQGADQYSLNGTTLTFNSPIPAGTNKVFVKGGTSLTIGVPGASTVTDSSVASNSNLYNRIHDWIDVKDYGAKGNGATDDTAAIQLAINLLPASGGTIYFPAGTYNVSSTIQIGNGSSSAFSTRTGVVLVGAGSPGLTDFLATGFNSNPSTKIQWTGGTAPVFLVQGPLIGWGLQNFAIDGNAQATTCISLFSASAGDCQNLTLTGYTVNGILSGSYATFTGATLTDSIQNCWRNTTLENPPVTNVAAILLDGSANSTSDYHLFLQTTIAMNSAVANKGIIFRATDSCGFIGVHIFGAPPGGGGIIFDYSFRQFWPSGCWLQAVDNGCGWANIGTPGIVGGTVGANVLHSVLTANGNGYPSLPNLSVPALPGRFAELTLTGQNAAVSPNAITPYPVLSSGLYRVSGYLFITAAGSAGGTVTPKMTWNDGSNLGSVSGNSIAPNTGYSQFSSMIYAVAGTNISYEVDFSGVTTNPTYTAIFNVEQLT